MTETQKDKKFSDNKKKPNSDWAKPSQNLATIIEKEDKPKAKRFEKTKK